MGSTITPMQEGTRKKGLEIFGPPGTLCHIDTPLRVEQQLNEGSGPWQA